MFEVKEKPYGFQVTFEGFLQGEDIMQFGDAVKTHVARQSGDYAVLVDLREMRTFPQDAQKKLMEVILYCKERGMNRNAVVVNSAITKIQANRLAKETQIEDIRFIDAAQVDDWHQTAEDWLVRGKEPGRMAS